MYRFLLIFIVCLFGTFQGTSQVTLPFYEQTNVFLKEHVDNGQVSYKSIDRKQLKKLTQLIATAKIDNLSPLEQKAFLINAYNLLVIQSVKENYPIASPQEITGFFDWKKYPLANKKVTLNELEKDLLLKKFQDPRLHFVLVCAAKSCPPIIPEAYRSEKLEQQLDNQTRLAVNDAQFIYLNPTEKTAYLSEIFRWYSDDFKAAGGVRAFINQYRASPIPKDYKIRYYEYNWKLNDANPVKRTGNPSFYRATRLLQKKQFELKIFNSLYTQKQFDGFPTVNSRSSFFSSFFQYLHGSNQPFNFGVDFVIRSQVVNDFVDNSPFKALQTSNFDEFRSSQMDSLRNSDGRTIQTYGRFGASHIGPKIKFHPFKNNRNFSFQQTIYIPIDMDVDGQSISFTQLFYDKLIGTQTQIFVEASLWTPLSPTFRIDPFFKVFYSYFPTNRWTLYGMVGLPNELGVGTKYLVTKNFEVELLYTHYSIDNLINNNRRAQTFNLGLRFMR